MHVDYLNIIFELSHTSNIVMRVRRMWIASLVFGTLSYIYSGTSKLTLRAGRSGGRIPVAATFSAPVQTGAGRHPASYTMGTGSFLGGKAAGA